MAYKFGPHTITRTEIFYATRLTFGLVNLKPVTPGHVLVIPRRVVSRFCDLSDEESVDMIRAVRRIGPIIEREFQGESLTITVQDGPKAGQTVPHVHFHIMPRRMGDWADNDDVYPAINYSERQMDKTFRGHVDVKAGSEIDRKPRSQEEMAAEAKKLRALLHEVNGWTDIWDSNIAMPI